MSERSVQVRLKHSTWPVVGLLLAASVLLLHDLATDSLWGDEIFTASFSVLPLRETIAWTAADIHPPFYYLLAGLLARSQWLWPVGPPSIVTDWLWRWPSALAGLFSVAVTYRLGKETLGRSIGFLAAALLAVAPVAIKYGQEARMHALFMGLSALATLGLVLAWRGGGWRYWLGYAVTTALNLYTMYFAFLIVAAHGLWVLVQTWDARSFENSFKFQVSSFKRPVSRLVSGVGGERQAGDSPSAKESGIYAGRRWPRGLLSWLVSIGLAGLAYGPWWPVLLGILARRLAVGPVEGGVGAPGNFLAEVVAALGVGQVWAAWTFFGLYLLGLVLAARRGRSSLAVLGAAWVTLPALLPLLVGDPRAVHLRYAFVLPVFLLFVAVSLQALAHSLAKLSPSRPRTVQLYVGWLAMTVSLYGTLTVYAQTKPDWRGAAGYLSRTVAPGDVVVTGPLWDDGRFLSYYYSGPAEVLTPAGFVAALPGRAEAMRSVGGRVWLVNRFTPDLGQALRAEELAGVTISKPVIAIYETQVLRQAMIDLCRQAIAAADPWAAAMKAGGVLNPDPRTARAAGYLCLGDTLVAAGRIDEAVAAYQTMVDIFPGWVGGYLSLAETHERRGDLPAAVVAYKQAVAYNPAWQSALADEAVALVNQGEYEAALDIYHRLVGNE